MWSINIYSFYFTHLLGGMICILYISSEDKIVWKSKYQKCFMIWRNISTEEWNINNVQLSFFTAKPPPVVTWSRNEIVVSNQSVAVPSGTTSFVRSELRITGLGRRDVHSELTCRASNNNRTPPLAATLHVDMNCKYLASYSKRSFQSKFIISKIFFRFYNNLYCLI